MTGNEMAAIANNVLITPGFVTAAFVLLFWRIRIVEKQINNGLVAKIESILAKLVKMETKCDERRLRIEKLE